MIYDNIDSAYIDYKYKLLDYGEVIVDQRGDKVYQLPFHSITFKDFVKKVGGIEYIDIPSNTFLNYDAMKKYAEQLVDGDVQDFIYTYGNRLIEHFGINQYEVMINRIKEDIHTRRAIAITYDQVNDNCIEDIPCLIMLKLMVYDGKLDMSVVFRSNDIKYAFVSNLYGLMCVQLYLAKELGLPVGSLHYVCFDCHWKEI